MFENISSEYFNLAEGVFWLTLGFISATASLRVTDMYKKLTLYLTFVLLTFGASDFVQVLYGSFLVPGMEWLFIWKIIDVIALGVIVLWYLKLRFDDKKC
jgi:hypothetical protein